MDVIKALSFIYVILSIIDAAITATLLQILMAHNELHHIEANPIVVKFIERFGIKGMLVYKFVTVVCAISIILYIHKNNHKRHSLFQRFVKPHYIMWLGILGTLAAIVCGLAYGILYFW